MGPADGWVSVHVLDHGRGVSSSDQDQTFEPFFRSKPNEPGFRGVGLRLTVVRKLWSAWAAILAPSRETEGPMRALRSRQ